MNKNKHINIRKIRLDSCHQAEGLVVVIDVIRAFTTAAYAFAAGVEKIFLTGEVEEALELHKQFPDSILAGEVDGIPIPGFHFGNSPVEIAKHSLTGKMMIFRTSSGTQGVVRSKQASRLLVSSFSVAESTLKRIQFLEPDCVTFVITGQKKGGWEDLALADYLDTRLCYGHTDPSPYLERVKSSPSGILFSSGTISHFQKHDLDATCEVDKFDFAMEVFRENNLQVLRPVTHTGQILSKVKPPDYKCISV